MAGYNDGFLNTSPVGSFAVNRFGLFDMGGNAWQWCEDGFDASQNGHVLRSASWLRNNRSDLLSSFRGHAVPSIRTNGNGFRCVLAEE